MNTWTRSLFLLFILFSFINPAQAATPQTVNYQGILTDNLGVPVNTAVAMEVHIYDAVTDGTELYSESHGTVAVIYGVFALALGGGTTPTGTFDATTFASNTTWLELVVGGEIQLPRLAFLSVPYALHAEDASTLEGLSATNLDQSAHVTDTGNPHGVSAAQVGAATGAELTSHRADSCKRI